jgi:hypothetical protein
MLTVSETYKNYQNGTLSIEQSADALWKGEVEVGEEIESVDMTQGLKIYSVHC